MLFGYITRRSRLLLVLMVVATGAWDAAADAWNVVDIQVADGAAWYLEGNRMCRTDGTTAGSACFETAGTRYSPAARGALLHGKFYAAIFTDRDRASLFEFDGLTAPRPVLEFASAGRGVASMGDHLFFTRRRTLGGVDLMRSDGTAAGTSAVAMLAATEVDVSASAGGFVFLTGQAGPWGRTRSRLWASDGTREGTVVIAENAQRVVALGRVVLFRSSDRFQPQGELWRSDGTVAGTYRLAEAVDGQIGIHGDAAFFTSAGAVWRTDGTTTTAIRTAPFRPFHTGMAGGRLLLFQAVDGTMKIWSASMLSSAAPNVIATFSVSPETEPAAIFYAGGLAFVAVSQSGGNRLWSTDGTPAGTRTTGARMQSGNVAADFDGKLFFLAQHPVHGVEPWISDGTREGTHIFANMDPEGSVSGVVTDAATGQPVANALVVADARAVTAANGRYVLAGVRPGTRSLRVTARGYREAFASTQVEAGEEHVVDIALERGARVTGKVVDSSGTPIEGTRVQVRVDGDMPYETKTNNSGRFELDPLRTARPWTLEVTAPGFASHVEGSTIPLQPGETRDVHVTLERLGGVRARLVDAMTGRALWKARGTLDFFTADGTLRASFPIEDPVERVALPDGRYHMLATFHFGSHAATWYPGTECITPCASRPKTSVQGTPLQVTAGTTLDVDFAIRPLLGQIRGVFVDAQTGAHLNGGRVEIRHESGARHDVSLDPWKRDATFGTSPSLPTGRYTVTFRTNYYDASHVYLDATPSVSVDIGAGEAIFVELQVTRGATIRGRVTDARTGEILRDIPLRLSPGGYFARTDAVGGYAMSGVPSGSYRLASEAAWYSPKTVDVVVTAGEKTTVHIALQPHVP